uniref:Uncharacterized protein n=1 Tax=Anguilla anguilla TaxID=7936 RepID=A0A0E9XCJ3_ANGAN
MTPSKQILNKLTYSLFHITLASKLDFNRGISGNHHWNMKSHRVTPQLQDSLSDLI